MIQTFPQATPEGDWLPQTHNVLVYLNFTHTRIGAMLVTILVLWLAVRALGSGSAFTRRPAALLVWLLAAQITLGVSVVLYGKPLIVTTFHVLNGAALLALTVLLAARTTRSRESALTAMTSSRVMESREANA